MFHANDGDNVTVSNALGVIVLELGDKWIVELSFDNPKKELLIDALLNLIMVNDQLIFWKRFFF
jgi:phosphotransferase system HPr-like phosphotransfer protein